MLNLGGEKILKIAVTVVALCIFGNACATTIDGMAVHIVDGVKPSGNLLENSNPGEYIDNMSRNLYWETADLSVPGENGMDISVYRSFGKTNQVKYSVMHNWELETPRILVPTNLWGDTEGLYGEQSVGLGRGGSGLCNNPRPKFLWKGTIWEYWIDPPHYGGMINVKKSPVREKQPKYSYAYQTGIKLVIPGQAPKDLLVKIDNLAGYPSSAKYITKDNWMVECIATNNTRNRMDGFLVRSPAGITYTMDQIARVSGTGEPGTAIAHASKVEDRFGNSLTYQYEVLGIGYYNCHRENGLRSRQVDNPYYATPRTLLLTSISSSDGRIVDFEYRDEPAYHKVADGSDYVDYPNIYYSFSFEKQNFGYPFAPPLEKVHFDGKTWEYRYVDGRLQSVILPENDLIWEYEYYVGGPSDGKYFINFSTSYYHDSYRFNNLVSRYLLKNVTLPYGGKIAYEYESVPGNFWRKGAASDSTYCLKKRTLFAGVEGQSPSTEWIYNSEKIDNQTKLYTQIDKPLQSVRYTYDRDEYSWRYGSLLKQEIFDSKGTKPLVQTITYDWVDNGVIGKMGLGIENWESHLSKKFLPESYYHRVSLKKKTIDSKYSTEFFDFDNYGNPAKIVEAGDATKTTLKTYINETSKWLIGLPDTETVLELSGNNVIDYNYHSNYLLESENKYGLLTSYDYHPSGELWTVTDGNGSSTIYEDYYRGIPRKIKMPISQNGGTIYYGVSDRVVNYDGTIHSETITETDGKKITTQYTYDDLGRTTWITPPQGDSVEISYEPQIITKSRGSFSEINHLDGLGRVKRVELWDTNADAMLSEVRTDYNSAGLVEYKFNPSSDLKIEYQYDPLGRVDLVINQDNTQIDYEYVSLDEVLVTDAEDYVTRYKYRTIGSQANNSLVEIENYDQDGSLYNRTQILRDILGNFDLVIQGLGNQAVSRDYNFNSNQLLEWIVDPEVGKTEFWYDNAANIKYKRVNSTEDNQRIEFVYDLSNRNTEIIYPEATSETAHTPNRSIEYDNRGNIVNISFDGVIRSYGYDNNGNLDWEELEIDGKNYLLDYLYTNQDNLYGYNYPSQGEVGNVNYSLDVLGRPENITAAGQTIVSDVARIPSGTQTSISYANGKSSTTTLTSRFRVDQISLPNGTNIDYNYYDNGNVSEILNLPGGSITNIDYDPMQRLKAADGPWGTGDIQYDLVGNITNKTMGNEHIAYAYDDLSNNLSTVSVNNHGYMTNYSMQYDQYGNITSDGSFDYRYDHAGNMVSTNNGDITYLYDGNGIRAKKIASGSSDAHFFYSKTGQLIGEYRSNGSSTEYVYLGSQVVAKVESSFNFELPETAIGGKKDSDGKVTLSWENDPGAVTYEVQISSDPNFGSGVTTIYSGSGSQAQIENLEDGVWYVRIRSCSGNECENWYAAEEPIVVERKWIPIATGDITFIIPLVD